MSINNSAEGAPERRRIGEFGGQLSPHASKLEPSKQNWRVFRVNRQETTPYFAANVGPIPPYRLPQKTALSELPVACKSEF
ncbi:hypothetical protein J6590_071695 [Homalodisca vitripennis]|nr:hypothetical protein J6590_071695 [Homalodisca vitripennis]